MRDNALLSLDEDIVCGLMKMLDGTNELVKLFRNAKQRTANSECPSYTICLLGKRDGDLRQYDTPSSNDVSGLVVGDIGDFCSKHDIIIESCSGSLQRISKLYPKFMSLQYPLLFPYGKYGYQCDIMFANNDQQSLRKRLRVPMRAYYAYLINEIGGFKNIIIKGGYTNNFWLMQRDCIRANQNDLRIEVYKGIHEAVLKGDVDGNATRKVIVPSSLNGSPHYMINNYQDAYMQDL